MYALPIHILPTILTTIHILPTILTTIHILPTILTTIHQSTAHKLKAYIQFIEASTPVHGDWPNLGAWATITRLLSKCARLGQSTQDPDLAQVLDHASRVVFLLMRDRVLLSPRQALIPGLNALRHCQVHQTHLYFSCLVSLVTSKQVRKECSHTLMQGLFADCLLLLPYIESRVETHTFRIEGLLPVLEFLSKGAPTDSLHQNTGMDALLSSGMIRLLLSQWMEKR